MAVLKGSTPEFSAIRARHWKPTGHSVRLNRHGRKVGGRAEISAPLASGRRACAGAELEAGVAFAQGRSS